MMEEKRACECKFCVFGREQVSDYRCDIEPFLLDVPHEHKSVRYVSRAEAVRCDVCQERVGEGSVCCQHPDCSYALCLQCFPAQLVGECWDSERFVNQEHSSEFECVLCSNICKQVVELECGHTYGQQCLQSILRTPPPHNCPYCQKPFTPDQVHPVRSVRLKILSYDAYCQHKAAGCEFRGTLAAVLRHQISACMYRRVTCTQPHCHADIPFHSQAQHHQVHCKVPCLAPDCQQSLPRTELAAHLLQQHMPGFGPYLKQQEERVTQLEAKLNQVQQENAQLKQQVYLGWVG
eukprot:TRINITY_DN3009_c0_g1_i4.p1 TRINITY_DN3009_c0_g1~~TRINITY_DN3009_c0_g1_i4.p1  ORF type:complete len:292 (-),score=40.00 TRINITY_DN3009_c0_g1_i4:106-981(-)